MDKETEALFYAIWFPFLLELAKVYIFPRDVCSSLGDDIEVQLKRFIITGQPIPNTIDMANQIRGHCKMGTFAALETVIHEFLNFQLVTLWIEYERTGVNRSNWQGAPNLLQSTLQPADLTNTENYKNFAKTKKLERVDPSGTVDYGRIIDSSFASVATTSTREDQTVPNQANINVLVNELPDGRLQIGRQGLIAMDNESEAHFYAIWLPFLMGLAKACVFPRHICSSLGDDIEVQLKAFIVTGQPVPNARYMTNRIRHVTGGFHYKNAHFTALMDKLEEKVQKHLIAHLFRLRNEYNMLAGVNGCEWHSGFNLQQPAVESMNTENCGNSDQERVVPSGTVDYGRIIDSSFASVTTYSTGGDWTVTCQASANVAVNELPDESVQIGRQGGIADRNLGPSTSQCSSSAAANKYEPIWLPSFNLQQPAVESMNTENCGNSDQERVDPSGTVDYGRIIDSSFASVATTSTREDQTVPNQANINVLVNELPDGRFQIGRQGLIADLNPGPSTSRCSTSAAIDKYEPIWLPFPLWPATLDQYIAEDKGFQSVLAGRKFYEVPKETPILRSYTRKVNINKIREEYEAELAILVDRSRRGECTSAEKERIAELKPRVKQNSNTKIKDEKRKKELQNRQELLKALCKETRTYHMTLNSLNLRIQAIPDELLRSKLEGTVRAIRHFVESRREENKDTLVPGKVTDNKYKLQMVSWKGECDILRELRELFERLIHMVPSAELSQEVTMGLKRRNQPQVDEPATKKPAAQVNNLLLCNVSCPEEDTINEDSQLLEPNTMPASSMFTEQGALLEYLLRPETTVDLTNTAIPLEPEDEGDEEDYAESSLRAQQQEEGDHHKNNIWDVPLDNNLGGRWDTSTSNISYPQVPEEKDYDYDWREDW